jgi:hypothetical protein
LTVITPFLCHDIQRAFDLLKGKVEQVMSAMPGSDSGKEQDVKTNEEAYGAKVERGNGEVEDGIESEQAVEDEIHRTAEAYRHTRKTHHDTHEANKRPIQVVQEHLQPTRTHIIQLLMQAVQRARWTPR